jgi:hypothetical protein
MTHNCGGLHQSAPNPPPHTVLTSEDLSVVDSGLVAAGEGGAGVPHPLAGLVIVCTVQILALLLLVGGGAGVPHPLAGLVMYVLYRSWPCCCWWGAEQGCHTPWLV